jgi:TolB-like protein
LNKTRWITKLLAIIPVLFSYALSQKTVAVLDFEGIGVPSDITRALSNRFASEFLDLSKGKYVLIERQQMGEILKEQGVQMSGCVTSECAVEVGNALGAQFMITGSISKVGTIFTISTRLVDVETTKVISSSDYDHLSPDISGVMTHGIKKAAALLVLHKYLPDQDSAGDNKSTPKQAVIILPLEVTLGEAFEKATLMEELKDWIRGEVTFSEKVNLIDYGTEKAIIASGEYESGVMSDSVAKEIGERVGATHVITWTLRVTETKCHLIFKHFNIVAKPDTVSKSKWLVGGIRVRFSTKKDLEDLKMNVRKYTWPLLGAAAPDGRFPADSFFARLWMKIKIAIDSFFFYIEFMYGAAYVISILLLLSGLGLGVGYKVVTGGDGGPGIEFPPDYPEGK